MTHIGAWDFALIVCVSLQATAMAYVRLPRAKALLYCLPVPFTCASMALNKPIGATHVLGLMLSVLYMHSVRWLHYSLRVPILMAIAAGATGYCGVGITLAGCIPNTQAVFWLALFVNALVGIVLLATMREKDEQAYRSPLPIGLKLAIMTAVIAALVMLKQCLIGFMTGFPMMGVVAAYEARKSLWTLARQLPILMIAMVPLMAICRVAEPRLGIGLALGLGLLAWAATMMLFAKRWWPRAGANTAASQEGAVTGGEAVR